ncbi:MAG: phosphohistidine phosphatase SixA [Halobacteriota archaeon]
MKLYLVQHAEPKPKDEDPERPLSDKGREDIKIMASFLERKDLKVEKILHSGKLRAKKTAEALNEAFKPSKGVEESEGLKAKDDPTIWGNKLKEGDGGDTVLVGHLPHLSKLAGFLIANDPERKVVEFKMGGVVCLGLDEEANWSVEWMVTPQILK